MPFKLISLIFSNKILYILIGFICLISLTLYQNRKINNQKEIISSLGQEIVALEITKELINSNLNECNLRIAIQNKSIKKLETKNKDLKHKQEELQKELKESFKDIPKDNDCKSKIEFYESIFERLSK